MENFTSKDFAIPFQRGFARLFWNKYFFFVIIWKNSYSNTLSDKFRWFDPFSYFYVSLVSLLRSDSLLRVILLLAKCLVCQAKGSAAFFYSVSFPLSCTFGIWRFFGCPSKELHRSSKPLEWEMKKNIEEISLVENSGARFFLIFISFFMRCTESGWSRARLAVLLVGKRK